MSRTKLIVPIPMLSPIRHLTSNQVIVGSSPNMRRIYIEKYQFLTLSYIRRNSIDCSSHDMVDDNIDIELFITKNLRPQLAHTMQHMLGFSACSMLYVPRINKRHDWDLVNTTLVYLSMDRVLDQHYVS